MKKILLFLVCLFIFPLVSYADSCESETYISELTNNVNITYSITLNGNTPVYTIFITNLTSDMLLYDGVKGKTYKGFTSKNNKLVVRTTTNGKYSFDIFSLRCKSNIRTISVDLPKYNKYYKDSRCKGFENYPLCQRWSEYQANDKTFENDINTLINNSKKQNKTVEETKTKEKEKWYKLLSGMFVKYWWAFLIIAVALMGLFYVIRAQHKKKEYNFKL